MLKNNSRFASLVDDSGGKKSVFGKKNNKKEELKPDTKIESKIDTHNSFTSNSFKNERPMFQQRDNYRRPYGRDKEIMEMLEKQEQVKKVEEEKRKEAEKMAALAIESFPELGKVSSKPVSSKPVSTTNFIEKLKTSVKVETHAKHVLKPGWTEMRWDPLTNGTKMVSDVTPIYEKPQENLFYEVLENLAYLHEKRSAEYIDNWGEDEWEKMFLFQNYDYHYFDKLDEIYAKNNPNSHEHEQFSDEDEEFWKRY